VNVIASWEKPLERWRNAGLLDDATASRIRAFENASGNGEKLRWPILLALGLGGLLLGAGVLLFVAAHWDGLSTGERFGLVLLMVAAFPIAGAFTAEKFPVLSATFYAVGTICAGAGIFLSAQIFNLQEHWPNGILLWAIAALAGWILLRQWAQATLLALLVPMWLAGEWSVRNEGFSIEYTVVIQGLLMLALAYLSARTGDDSRPTRRALVWIGGIAVLPLAVIAFLERHETWWWRQGKSSSTFAFIVAWCIAILGPLAVSFVLRKQAAWMNAVAAAWVLMIGTFGPVNSYKTGVSSHFIWDSIGPYLWATIGAVGLIAWGIAEHRRERINAGVAGFALTVLIFYFSDVMDKLGRSASLIGAGVLLLLGGWGLERARRQLIARMEGSPA
jgi:uncharacterized membrane protein